MLRNKCILLVSPQSWGNMFIAKHHYAVELAKLNNVVYFLNPPTPKMKLSGREARIKIEKSPVHENLFIVHHQLFFPYILKFHFKSLFRLLMKFQVKSILKTIGRKPDIIWSFDLGYMYPLKYFPEKAYKIFHPVDEPTLPESIKCAEGANIIFSVTKEILEKYEAYSVPRIFVHHGVSKMFFEQANVPKTNGKSIHVGVSGNFLRPDIDREIFLRIIDENPSVIFECWGAYQESQANLGGMDVPGTSNFIKALKERKNVILHGAVKPEQLAKEYGKMDAFLICYDVQKDASKGTNYHKIMEYLSTGKVVIANNVTTYRDASDLVRMVNERDHNEKLPALFKEIISNLEKYNSEDLRKKRIDFAYSNLYSKNVELIEQSIFVP